jgi:hypothetical protein
MEENKPLNLFSALYVIENNPSQKTGRERGIFTRNGKLL